jgi:hypothetical protein
MKKQYIQPAVVIVETQTAQMIAASIEQQVNVAVYNEAEEMDAEAALAAERGDIEIPQETDVWENGLW